VNDGLTTTANLTASQALLGNNKRICPGPDGGIEMSPAVDGNILYVATQNACGVMTTGPYPYKGQTLSPGYIYNDDPTASQNSTLYAIDLSTGSVVWHYEMPNRYQGSSAVVSGGVVYAVDRGGILYELNAQNGGMINSFELGGVGAAGVSIARDTHGNMMVFVPSGGGESAGAATAGVLTAFWLGPLTSSTTTGVGTGNLEEPIIIALGVIVVILAMYVLIKRREPTRPRAPSR